MLSFAYFSALIGILLAKSTTNHPVYLQWQNGRRGQDGWGRWTRRRKWYRDAELVEIDNDENGHTEASPTTGEATGVSSDMPTPSSERAPSLPPRPAMPTLAPPFTTTSESLNLPDLTALKEVEEETVGDPDAADEKADDVASILSTSSKSTGRFRMPSLRRRVTDNKQQQQHTAQIDRDSITSSPRSIAGAERRSRRTSEAQSEDEAASLRHLGIARIPSDSWGVGDEVVMGLD